MNIHLLEMHNLMIDAGFTEDQIAAEMAYLTEAEELTAHITPRRLAELILLKEVLA